MLGAVLYVEYILDLSCFTLLLTSKSDYRRILTSFTLPSILERIVGAKWVQRLVAMPNLPSS